MHLPCWSLLEMRREHGGWHRLKSISLTARRIIRILIGGVWGCRGRSGGECPPRSEPIDFVRSINTKIFSHCLILFALSYFNEYVKAKLFIINVKKKNLRDEKNQKLAPICDVSGQIFRSFHTAHRKRFDCKFIRREDRGHLRKSEKRRILLH